MPYHQVFLGGVNGIQSKFFGCHMNGIAKIKTRDQEWHRSMRVLPGWPKARDVDRDGIPILMYFHKGSIMEPNFK